MALNEHKVAYKVLGGRYMKVLEWITAKTLFKYYTIEDTGNGYYRAYQKETVLDLPIECPYDHIMIWNLWAEPNFFCFYDPYTKRFFKKEEREYESEIYKTDTSPGLMILDMSPKFSDTMPLEYKNKPVMVVTK
jgi:hypothetical protein